MEGNTGGKLFVTVATKNPVDLKKKKSNLFC